MFKSKNIILSDKDIPSSWIFETYLNLPKLHGQTIMINSVFNDKDHTPSMSIYCNENGAYLFNCFSTGIKGSAIYMLSKLWDKPFVETFRIVKDDYLKFLESGNIDNVILPITKKPRWKVNNYSVRRWNKDDELYFYKKYGISSSWLDYYNIKPLKCFSLCLEDDSNGFTITKNRLYGYFTKENELYKIYDPENRKKKFIKIPNNKKYIQGMDQCKNYPVLLITSSLKDAVFIKSLQLRLDVLAPDSENVILDSSVIKDLKSKYKKILVMLDSDAEGIKAMKKYKEMYDLDFIYFELAKDPTDACEYYDRQTIKLYIARKINSYL